MDKSDSLNGAGGAIFEDIASAMYVNNKKVEVQGEYNSSTGLFEYDKPGMVIEEKTLEMGD